MGLSTASKGLGTTRSKKTTTSGKKVPYPQSGDGEHPGAQTIVRSLCWVGKTRDYRMFQGEFPPEQPWFEHFRLRVDLGFLVIAPDYVCKEVLIPHKKLRKQDLTPEQKAENKVLASQHIVVEHAHAGLKRYRILSDRLRMHNLVLYHVVLGVCAGLWNFSLSH